MKSGTRWKNGPGATEVDEIGGCTVCASNNDLQVTYVACGKTHGW